jgi:hypothetical protein
LILCVGCVCWLPNMPMQAAMDLPILKKQVMDQSNRKDISKLHDGLLFREGMRALLCRACTLSLRAVRDGDPRLRMAEFQTAVQACTSLYFQTEPQTFPNSPSAKFSSEILSICLDSTIRADAISSSGLSSPRRPASTVYRAPNYDAINCVHDVCQFLALECSFCLKIGSRTIPLTCGHRLCADCYMVADKCVMNTVAVTPAPSLNATQFIPVTCPISEKCGGVGRASAGGQQKRLPVHFAVLLRLKALKRETEIIQQMQGLDTLAHASVIRKRIHSIVDGGKEDMFSHRPAFALRLSEHLLPQLEALFEACNRYHRHSEYPDLHLISDATIRSILSYINSPAIASHRSGV